MDIDRDLLDRCVEWTEPLIYEHLDPREHTELRMHLVEGSVADKDGRMEGADAVTAIEL